MKPTVSVIVPVYRVEQYLDECVRSLTGQTLKNIEIILVDDGSDDTCPMLCDHYQQCIPILRSFIKKIAEFRQQGMPVLQLRQENILLFVILMIQ